jgi:hypothetical protein
MHKKFGKHFWDLVSTGFKYSFHIPFLHYKSSQNSLFKIIDDICIKQSRNGCKKHPSEQQKGENREREQG